MAGRLLQSGPITSTFWHDQPADDAYVIESVQDVEDIVDVNKAQYNSTDERARWGTKGGETLIARIPLTIYFDLMRQGIINHKGEGDEQRFTAWLNAPENRFFRTRPGRV